MPIGCSFTDNRRIITLVTLLRPLFLLRTEAEWGCSHAGQTHSNNVETVNEIIEGTKKTRQAWGKIFSSELICYSRNLLVIAPHITGGHTQRWWRHLIAVPKCGNKIVIVFKKQNIVSDTPRGITFHTSYHVAWTMTGFPKTNETTPNSGDFMSCGSHFP
jgi:hypothetical protein